ncbi:hypothetical protein DH2020_044937 [Rehmannia glutinosa]|uniref:Uncharacterized protein n=1 Tax=Rehmannia glutinosa TaxID=99300 RepID=A0ABR0UFL7_REHGL
MAPSSSLPSSSNNLPITGPNPKSRPRSDPPTVPPNSASSSSTTNAAPPDKRTRDLPNLSDCHCCGRRINYTNPKDRLQPLDSVWRIVLLCRKCRKKVGSGQTCPYCFKETGNSGDHLTCSVCERKIHRDCVRDYGNCTPWCYLGAGLDGFRVCVDCWVPELLKNSIRVCGRSESKGGSKDKGEAKVLLKNLVKNAKCEAGKKMKDQALSRAKVAKNVVDLDNGALDLLAKNGKDSSKAENLNCNGTIEVVDDAELAIQLHRAMNSSPRILRSKPVVNSNALDVLNIRHWNGLSYKRSRIGKNRGEDQKLGTFANNAENERMMNRLGENNSCIGVTGLYLGLQCYKRDKMRKIWQLDEDNTVVSDSKSSSPAEQKCNLHSDDSRTSCSMNSDADISEAPICVNADRNNVDRFGHELVIYKRSRFKRKLCQADGLVGVSGECCSLDNRGMAFLSESCKLDETELGTGCQVKSDTEANLPSGDCNADRDRYHLKYSKRTTGTKSGSSFLHFGTFLSENQASAHALNNSEAGTDAERHRYHLKYAKRTTGTKPDSSFLHYGTLLGEKYQASAPALSDGKLILQIGTSKDPDRYCFKYTKRVKSSKSGAISETKVQSDAFLKDIEASAARLTANCSAESRTLSDVTFDSFTTDLPK